MLAHKLLDSFNSLFIVILLDVSVPAKNPPSKAIFGPNVLKFSIVNAEVSEYCWFLSKYADFKYIITINNTKHYIFCFLNKLEANSK